MMAAIGVVVAGNFTCLEVVFVLKRRLGYYFFHTYIPTCLIVIMSVSDPFGDWLVSVLQEVGSVPLIFNWI